MRKKSGLGCLARRVRRCVDVIDVRASFNADDEFAGCFFVWFVEVVGDFPHVINDGVRRLRGDAYGEGRAEGDVECWCGYRCRVY